jgi:hypothetical protein
VTFVACFVIVWFGGACFGWIMREWREESAAVSTEEDQ